MFIVFEGLEGAGKEAISKWCKSYLKKKGKTVVLVAYPDREGFCSKIIDKILTSKVKVPLKSKFLTFLADIAKDQDQIEEWINGGKTVIADRYYFSTIAYQQMDVEDSIKILSGLKLIKPNIVFYLNITPDISIERTKNERKHFSRYASDKERLLHAKLKYDLMLEKNVLSKWINVDATKPLDATTEEVKRHLDKLL